MSKEWKTFDLEDRLIDFAVRIIRIVESLPKTKIMKVCLKELRETRMWLIIIVRTKLMKPASKLESLLDENNQLISIFVKSIQTARQKRKKTS